MPTLTDDQLLDVTLKMPEHVVHRSFVEETVVLNLKTGKYHGLNATAGQMLDLLGQGVTVRLAATQLAAEYDVAEEQVREDLLRLCRGLLERELMEVVGGSA